MRLGAGEAIGLPRHHAAKVRQEKICGAVIPERMTALFCGLVSMDLDIASFVSIKRLLGGHKA